MTNEDVDFKPWLILTEMPVPNSPHRARVVGWEYGAQKVIEATMRVRLGPGTHYLVPLENAITLDIRIQAAEPSLIIK